jgi:quinol monooxygenase YgiN
MIVAIIRMDVLPDKRMELSQTIASLSGSIRQEKGCKRYDFCHSVEDENKLFILEEWDTQENLTAHLKSENSSVLRGAMNFLQAPYERTFYSVSHTAGIENI